MTSLTLRNIPDEVTKKVRFLAQREHRSLNQQFIVLLEQALNATVSMRNAPSKPPIPREVQIAMWKQLAGKWKDSRSTTEIVQDIYASRTKGRRIAL